MEQFVDFSAVMTSAEESAIAGGDGFLGAVGDGIIWGTLIGAVVCLACPVIGIPLVLGAAADIITVCAGGGALVGAGVWGFNQVAAWATCSNPYPC